MVNMWTIYGKDGGAKATVKELELHDEWMAECFITVSVKSAEPIEFAVGDYIDYRGERYSINYDPSVIKKARRGSYGEGFTYDNIKFVSVQDEIARCDFNDIVLSDNNIHYTALPTFPFYCATVDDLLDRIQANLEELYPGGWIVISPDRVKDAQRGRCVGRESAFIAAYEQYIGSGSEFAYEKTDVPLTADNNTCWEALGWCNSAFGLNFIVRGRVVIVGTAGIITSSKFKYGKGNGLYEIERIGDSEQKIVTRLKAYGNETNLPMRYYANMNTRIYGTNTVEGDGIANLDVAFRKDYFKNEFSSGETDVTVEIGGVTYAAKAYANNETLNIIINVMTSVTIPLNARVYMVSGVQEASWPDDHREYAGGSGLPNNMAVTHLMLPGFPDVSLAAWVAENRPELLTEGFEFSTDSTRPYIDSSNKEFYGIRPSSIFFDGSDETEDIYPTIKGMGVDTITAAEQIEDNGVFMEGTVPNFKITLPNLGFDLAKYYQQGAKIEMTDGMCGGRGFEIASTPKQNDYNQWECECKRSEDTALNLWFPYNDFNIHTGDHYVLTGIDMPDEYIAAASVRLFDAAIDALRKNHAPRYTFQPRIDEIWMQRQDDIAKASGGVIESLHDTLKAGDIFAFADTDLGIDAKIIIDVLTIKENGNNGLPTYEVTLRDEKVVSTLQRTLNKISNSGSGGLGGNGSGGGSGYNTRQTESLIEEEGSELFLSKIRDDEAQGLIGFLKGAWFGTKNFIIDALGNANLNNITANGVLRALRAYINNVQSTNYSGDGMLDTGWRIINDYEGGNSKAVFDYLYIRKKAIFEELELRKLTHIGGNFCLSPASGRAWRVEYYDENDQRIGYEQYTVPYSLGGRLLALFSHNLANRFLSRKKYIQRELKPEERQLVRRVRVWMFCDDGTTQTMQNWTVGAQARCQTFNIEEQMDYHGSGVESDNDDVSYWTGQKVQNTYWWRLVSAVGDGICDDGKVHYYVDFLANQPNAYTFEDVGSDLPAVGDEFAQFGHRTRSDQSNVIMIETANEDSPAMKFYHGINSWNLDAKRPIMLSPTLVEMKASMFRWITEYGDETGQVTKRGLWINIQVDAIGNRRCYPNDVVAHNGSYWRCIVASGSHKEDSNGNWLTQAQVDAMTPEQQMELVEVENYTIQEPGPNSTDWVLYTDEAIAAYIKFSEALVAVPCEKDSKASAAVSKTITAKLMVTNLEATITSVTLEGADSFVSKSGNNIVVNVPKNAVVTNKDYTVTVEGNLNNNHYIATDKISLYGVIRGNDAYEVYVDPSQWIWNQDGANLTAEEIIQAIEDGTELTFHILIDGVEVLQDGSIGNSCAQISVINDGVNMPFTINSVVASDYHVGVSYNNLTGRVWVTSVPDTLESGWVDVNITYGDNTNLTKRIQFYCNLLGTWREQIIGDTRVAIADKTRYLDTLYTNFHAEYVQSSEQNSAHFQRVDTSIANLEAADVTLQGNIDAAETSLSNAISTAQTTLQGNIDATNTALSNAQTTLQGNIDTVSVNLATYEQTADGQITALTNRMSNAETSITNTNTRIDTAEGSIQTISSEIQTVDGKFASYSTTQQTSNMISSSVTSAVDGIEDKLYETGIDIYGDTRTITLRSDKITFAKADGTAANIWFDNIGDAYSIGNFLMAGDHLYGNNFNSDGSYASRGIEMYSTGSLAIINQTNGAALSTYGDVQLWGRSGSGFVPVFAISGRDVLIQQASSFEIATATTIKSDLTITTSSSYQTPKMKLLKGSSPSFEIYIDSNNKIRISAPLNSWPGVNEVNIGELYINGDDYLELKTDGSWTPGGGGGGGGGSVTSGTYTKVTVDTNGRVTNGENPTTLSGYGITDAAALNHNHDSRYAAGLTLVGNRLYLDDISGNTLDWEDLPSGGSASITGLSYNSSEDNVEATKDLWLHTDSSNFGSTLYFGDKSYCYITEYSDDCLKMYADKDLQIISGSNKQLTIKSESGQVEVTGNWNLSMYLNGYSTDDYRVQLSNTAKSLILYGKDSISMNHNPTVTSDINMKDEVSKLEVDLDVFAQAPLVRFTWKRDIEKTIHIGTYAQYWQQYIPDSVTENFEIDTDGNPTGESHLTLNYTEVLTAGVITIARNVLPLNDKVRIHESRIEALERKLSERSLELEQRIHETERQIDILNNNMYNNLIN